MFTLILKAEQVKVFIEFVCGRDMFIILLTGFIKALLPRMLAFHWFLTIGFDIYSNRTSKYSIKTVT